MRGSCKYFKSSTSYPPPLRSSSPPLRSSSPPLLFSSTSHPSLLPCTSPDSQAACYYEKVDERRGKEREDNNAIFQPLFLIFFSIRQRERRNCIPIVCVTVVISGFIEVVALSPMSPPPPRPSPSSSSPRLSPSLPHAFCQLIHRNRRFLPTR